MIKRTIYVGNPSLIYYENKQVKIEQDGKKIGSVPVEDIGLLVLDNQQISITHRVIQALQENDAAIISCDQKHIPFAIMLPFGGHHVQAERMRMQWNATEPLKKQLWKQTIEAKISNQAECLSRYGKDKKPLLVLSAGVRSGDTDNKEGRAARYYWQELFDNGFNRSRYGETPNAYLNYAYAILRSVIARALVSSGLSTALGIHHRNRYNMYSLADDIMEPYRPFSDETVYDMYCKGLTKEDVLTPQAKKMLLSTVSMDVKIANEKSPLMVAASRTTSSLYDCLTGTKKKILYPTFI